MQRDQGYLLDMLEAARLAVSYVQHMDKVGFLADVACQDAVIRRLEIIGEAARRVTAETRAAYPALPWTEMIGMRNILIHEYGDIDLSMVWETVRLDLPHIVSVLEP